MVKDYLSKSALTIRAKLREHYREAKTQKKVQGGVWFQRMVPEMAGDTAKTRTPFRGFYEIFVW